MGTTGSASNPHLWQSGWLHPRSTGSFTDRLGDSAPHRERDYLDVVAGVRQRRTGPGGQRARSGGSDRNGGAGLRRGGVQLWGMYVPPLGAPRWTNEKREKCTDRGLQAWRHAGTAGHGILCGREPTSNTSRHSVQRRLTREYGWGNVCRGRFVERSTKRCGEELAVTHGLDTARYVAASRGGEVFSVVVVVMGVGPLGMCHCIKAQAIGAGTLIAIDTSPVRLRAAATVLGAAITIDAAELARVERRDAVHDATGGRGADVVVDCTGSMDGLGKAVDLVRQGGVVVKAGAFVDLGRAKDFRPAAICSTEVAVLGLCGERSDHYAAALRLPQETARPMKLANLISHQFPFSAAHEALQTAINASSLKVLITSGAGR